MWGKHASPRREVHVTGRVSGEHWEDSDRPWYLSYIRNPSLQGDKRDGERDTGNTQNRGVGTQHGMGATSPHA